MVTDAYLSANNIDWDVDDAKFHGSDCIAQTQSGRIDNLDVVQCKMKFRARLCQLAFLSHWMLKINFFLVKQVLMQVMEDMTAKKQNVFNLLLMLDLH
eukprot:60804_1